MTFLLGCKDVSLAYPTCTVFDSLTLGLESGARVGVVGRNGRGKSSLIGVLAGDVEPDAGKVTRTSSVTVGVLAQRDSLADGDTVRDAITGGAPEHEWAGDARKRDVIDSLTGGLDFDGRVADLSGGERKRVDLARVLIGDYDVIMLDEPTNHLDVVAIDWLARHLKSRWRAGEGALVVVTHDRWFLDEVCTQMWEVHDGTVTPFEGGYSAYVQQRVERQRQADVIEKRRQNVLRRELDWLSRGPKARATKPKFRVEAARELLASDPPPAESLSLKRSAASRLGKKVVHFRNAGYELDGTWLLEPCDFNIGATDRIAILGANGIGKTTFLRLCTGELAPTKGRVEIGQSVRFGILDQNLGRLAGLERDRVREICNRHKTEVELTDGTKRSPMQLLGDLGFSREHLESQVAELSGGQKRILALMLVLIDSPNVLVLDEPGNDLDTDMLAQVESLLESWPATLVLVSHDRYLTERVTTSQYALVGGRLVHQPRGVEGYLESLAGGAAAPGGASVPGGAAAPDGGTGGPGESATLSQRDMRELKKRISSAERKMSTVRSKIADATAEMYSCDATDYETLFELQERVDSLRADLDELEGEWLEASELLGE